MKMIVSGWGCNLIGIINIILFMYFKDRKDNLVWVYNEDYYNKINLRIEKFIYKFK